MELILHWCIYKSSRIICWEAPPQWECSVAEQGCLPFFHQGPLIFLNNMIWLQAHKEFASLGTLYKSSELNEGSKTALNNLNYHSSIFQVLYCKPEQEVRYAEDVLIGPTTSNAESESRLYQHTSDYAYHTVLLREEGVISTYTNESGYVIGFTWYNSEDIPQQLEEVNLQLYIPSYFVNDSMNYFRLESTGVYSYYLVKETGWLEAKPGYNDYYLDGDTVRVNRRVDSRLYTMGITVRTNITVPVLYHTTPCNQTTWTLYRDSNDITNPGDKVMFVQHLPLSHQCLTFHINAIFLPSFYASAHFLRCHLILAKTDKEQEVTFGHKMSQPDVSYSDVILGHCDCWVIRAERPNYTVQLQPTLFHLADSTNCDLEHLFIYDVKDLHIIRTGFLPWGSFCGTKIFDERTTLNPYAILSFVSNITDPNRSFGFEFSVRAVPVSADGSLLVPILVPILVIVLLVVAVVVGVIIYKKRSYQEIPPDDNMRLEKLDK